MRGASALLRENGKRRRPESRRRPTPPAGEVLTAFLRVKKFDRSARSRQARWSPPTLLLFAERAIILCGFGHKFRGDKTIDCKGPPRARLPIVRAAEMKGRL